MFFSLSTIITYTVFFLFLFLGISCVSINFLLSLATGAFLVHIYAPMGHLVSPFSKLLHFVYLPPRYSLQAAPDAVDDVKRETEAVKSNISPQYC